MAQPHLHHPAHLSAQANRGCFSARELSAPETAAFSGPTSARSFVPMVTPRLPRAGRFSQPARIVRSLSPVEREQLSTSCTVSREVEVNRAQIGTKLFEDVLQHFQPRLSDPTGHGEQRRPAEVLRHSVQVPPYRSEAWTAMGRKSVSPHRSGVGCGVPGVPCQDTGADDFADSAPQTQPPPPTQQPQPPLQQHQHPWPPQISRQTVEDPGRQQQQYQHSWALAAQPTGSATVDATLKALENCRLGARSTLRDTTKQGGGGSLQLGKAGSILDPRQVQHRCLYPGDEAEEDVAVGQVRRRYSPRGGLAPPQSPGSLSQQQSRPLAPCRQRTSAGVLAQAEEAQELLRRVQCASSASASACAAAGLSSARGPPDEDTSRRPMFSGGATGSSQQPSARGPAPPGPPSPPKRQCRSLDRLLEMADLQPRGWDSPPVENPAGSAGSAAPLRVRRPRSPVAMSPASQALQQQLEHRELQALLQKQQQVLQQQQVFQQQEHQKLLLLQQQHQRLVQQQKQQLLEKKARQQEEKDQQAQEQQQKVAAAQQRRTLPCKPLQELPPEPKEQQHEENCNEEEEYLAPPTQQQQQEPHQQKHLTPEKGSLLGKETHAAEESVLSPSASTESPQTSDMDEDQLLSPTTPGNFEVDESARVDESVMYLPFEPLLDLLQAEDAQRCRDERVVHIQVPEGVGTDLKVRVQLKNMVLELEVPEDFEVGSVVACDPPTQPPMSGPVQRDLLVGGVLHQRLRWFQLADGNITCDDGPGGRYRCKLDALRAMRGRCMGAVLPRLLEEGDEDTMTSEVVEA